VKGSEDPKEKKRSTRSTFKSKRVPLVYPGEKMTGDEKNTKWKKKKQNSPRKGESDYASRGIGKDNPRVKTVHSKKSDIRKAEGNVQEISKNDRKLDA